MAVCVYAGLCLIFFFCQRSFIYMLPTQHDSQEPSGVVFSQTEAGGRHSLNRWP